MGDKHLPFEKRGDKIEVRLLDNDFNVYYKKVEPLPKIQNILDDLDRYGIKMIVKKRPNGRSWWD